MSKYQYFFAISSGCLNIYEDNTRSEFKNTLKKPFQISNLERGELNIAVDTTIFDNNFKVYSSKSYDLILRLHNRNFTLEFSDTFCISSIVERINKFFASAGKDLDFKEVVGHAIRLGSKIQLELFHGIVVISPEFLDFLELPKTLEEQYIQRGDLQYLYYKLRKENDLPKIYISMTDIQLNEIPPDYINICCDNIEYYPKDSYMQSNILCSLPINHHQQSTFYSPSFRNFFKLKNSSKLESIKLSFCQPSGKKVYFQYGAPNILKMAVSISDKKDFFYTQVSSAITPNFPDNTPSSFQVELPKEFQLQGSWQVGVVNVYIPRPRRLLTFDSSIYTIQPKDNYFIASSSTIDEFKSKYVKFPLLEFTKRELCIFLIHNFCEFFSVFVDQNEKIYLVTKPELGNNTQVQIFSSTEILQLVNTNKSLRVMNNTSISAIWRDRLQEVRVKFFQDEMSADNMGGLIIQKSFEEIKQDNLNELSFFFDSRVFYNINRVLEEDISRLDFQRVLAMADNEYLKKEETRLLHYIQNQEGLKPNQELLPSFFFIYSDFVSETVMADSFINLIKMVPYRSGYNNLPGGLFDFPRCEFFNVNKHYIKNIKFDVRTHSGKPYLFFPTDENILITLKFQKVS